MAHNCRTSLCDAPHAHEPRNRDQEMKDYVAWAEAREKELCPHGFRRVAGPFDCHFCVEGEK